MGSVPYLNALPLTAGVEDAIVQLPPAELARRLSDGRLDAALASSTEALFSPRYRALAGVGIVSRGPVYSVILAHREPLHGMRRVYLDTDSCTSVNLVRVLLGERGIRPDFFPLPAKADPTQYDNVLLIGNPAIDFRRAQTDHSVWDLGQAWDEMIKLPFTFAMWTFRDGFVSKPLTNALREVAEAGIAQIPALVAAHQEFDLPFRQAYLGGHIQYRLDQRAQDGLSRFSELLNRFTGRPVYPIRWVD
ncbi:MAG TPA: menaquinone biosynthesis protein [Verrucomicrobiota bacterium]|nr:menaquinone biosynthesis protein [Verrucomicrobiota bacterium]